MRTLEGSVLSSALISSMLFSRDTNSLLSAFSACISAESRLRTRFTWRHQSRPGQVDHIPPPPLPSLGRTGWTHVRDVVQAAEDVLSGLFGFKSRLLLVFFCGLKKKRGSVGTHTETDVRSNTLWGGGTAGIQSSTNSTVVKSKYLYITQLFDGKVSWLGHPNTIPGGVFSDCKISSVS